jgi:uncharacterized protein (DUF1501 family)
MNNDHNDGFSRRQFLQLSASLGVLASLGNLDWAMAAAPDDYKALVCIFLFGGNDGHNTIVPLDQQQYDAYAAARGSLTLARNTLLPVSDAQGEFGFHPLMPQTADLYRNGRAAVVANVGMLVGPTGWNDLDDPSKLPVNLRSHSDQVVQMQTGSTGGGSSSGWGGRAADSVASFNTSAVFPVSVSLSGSALFCAGNNVPAASLQPGNILSQSAMSLWPQSAADARAAAQRQVVTQTSSNQLINAANKQLAGGIDLHPLLEQAQSSIAWNRPFPATSLGRQLGDIARIISLHAQLGVGRQVFFASLGGFDTHSTQSWTQGVLLQEVDNAMRAFYDATEQLGLAQSVTAFTLSDFGRTLQASGSGSDHGWGNHHLVVGGAVQGSRIFGQFPLMTNYANLNATAEDYADTRGVLLPRQSLSQYGATLARWFGADPNATFANLGNFGSNTDLGFLG